MILSAILRGGVLFFMAAQFVAGPAAFAGCGGKGWVWDEPLSNYYCPAPGELLPEPSYGLMTPFIPPSERSPRIDYYAQMYSGQSRGGTLQIRAQMARRFRSTLGCCELKLRRIDLGFMGPYWSVWAGPVRSKSRAIELCQSLLLEGLRACVVEPQ